MPPWICIAGTAALQQSGLRDSCTSTTFVRQLDRQTRLDNLIQFRHAVLKISSLSISASDESSRWGKLDRLVGRQSCRNGRALLA